MICKFFKSLLFIDKFRFIGKNNCVTIKGNSNLILIYIPLPCNLLQNIGVFNLMVLSEEHDLGNDFGRFRVVVKEGQKNSAAVLGMHRQDVDCSAGHLVDHGAAEVDGIFAQGPPDQGMGAFKLHIGQFEEPQAFQQ